MSPSPTQECREADVALAAWPDQQALRWPYLAFDREAIAADALPAVCPTPTGALWEFDGRGFYVTDVTDGLRRRPAGDPALVPPGPWMHLAGCTCELCRLGNV